MRYICTAASHKSQYQLFSWWQSHLHQQTFNNYVLAFYLLNYYKRQQSIVINSTDFGISPHKPESGFATYELCDLGPAASTTCASVSLCVKGVQTQ